jgi:hypothetical protein
MSDGLWPRCISFLTDGCLIGASSRRRAAPRIPGPWPLPAKISKVSRLLNLLLLERCAHRHGARRIDGALAFLNALDYTRLVDHKGRAIRKLLLIVQDAIPFADLARHVAQQGELHAELLGELGIRVRAVNADAKNRGVVQIDFAIGDISLIRL